METKEEYSRERAWNEYGHPVPSKIEVENNKCNGCGGIFHGRTLEKGEFFCKCNKSEFKIEIHFTSNPERIRNSGMGDYYYDDYGRLHIVTYMKDKEHYNEARSIALHEFIEEWLTKSRGITEEEINAFDKTIDEKGGNADEAGDDPACPYYREHRFAENIERQVLLELKVNWKEYYDNYQIPEDVKKTINNG
jgi:hypothetical protein